MRLSMPHIQEYLDKEWPGVRLEFNEEYGYWLLTDYITAPDGSPATAMFYRTPRNLRALIDTPYTNRKLLFLLSHPDTGEPIEPSFFNIIETLKEAYMGASSRAWDHFLDRLEEREDTEKQRNQDEVRAGLRSAWRGSESARKGRIFASSAGITSSDRAQSFIEEQLRSQARQDRAMVTAAHRRNAYRRAVERYKQRANPNN